MVFRQVARNASVPAPVRSEQETEPVAPKVDAESIRKDVAKLAFEKGNADKIFTSLLHGTSDNSYDYGRAKSRTAQEGVASRLDNGTEVNDYHPNFEGRPRFDFSETQDIVSRTERTVQTTRGLLGRTRQHMVDQEVQTLVSEKVKLDFNLSEKLDIKVGQNDTVFVNGALQQGKKDLHLVQQDGGGSLAIVLGKGQTLKNISFDADRKVASIAIDGAELTISGVSSPSSLLIGRETGANSEAGFVPVTSVASTLQEGRAAMRLANANAVTTPAAEVPKQAAPPTAAPVPGFITERPTEEKSALLEFPLKPEAKPAAAPSPASMKPLEGVPDVTSDKTLARLREIFADRKVPSAPKSDAKPATASDPVVDKPSNGKTPVPPAAPKPEAKPAAAPSPVSMKPLEGKTEGQQVKLKSETAPAPAPVDPKLLHENKMLKEAVSKLGDAVTKNQARMQEAMAKLEASNLTVKESAPKVTENDTKTALLLKRVEEGNLRAAKAELKEEVNYQLLEKQEKPTTSKELNAVIRALSKEGQKELPSVEAVVAKIGETREAAKTAEVQRKWERDQNIENVMSNIPADLNLKGTRAWVDSNMSLYKSFDVEDKQAFIDFIKTTHDFRKDQQTFDPMDFFNKKLADSVVKELRSATKSESFTVLPSVPFGQSQTVTVFNPDPVRIAEILRSVDDLPGTKPFVKVHPNVAAIKNKLLAVDQKSIDARLDGKSVEAEAYLIKSLVGSGAVKTKEQLQKILEARKADPSQTAAIDAFYTKTFGTDIPSDVKAANAATIAQVKRADAKVKEAQERANKAAADAKEAEEKASKLSKEVDELLGVIER